MAQKLTYSIQTFDYSMKQKFIHSLIFQYRRTFGIKGYQYGINMCNKNMYHNVILIFKMLK